MIKKLKKDIEEMGLRITIGLYLAKFRLRAGRGNTWTSELKGMFLIMAGGGAILLTIEKYFGILLPLWVLPVIWVVQKVLEVIMGRIDEKYLKFWQIETEYLSRHLNPWNMELLDRVKKIQEKLDEHTKRDT
jgi:hypothetical protein